VGLHNKAEAHIYYADYYEQNEWNLFQSFIHTMVWPKLIQCCRNSICVMQIVRRFCWIATVLLK